MQVKLHDFTNNIILFPCGSVSANVFLLAKQYIKGLTFIPGPHKDTFSHCLHCGMSCLLCLSNNSLTMFSHIGKGNGCCLTQTLSCWFNNSLGHTASSHTIGQWWQRLKVALFIIFACVPVIQGTERPGSLQRTPLFLCFNNYRISSASRVTNPGSGGTRRTCGRQMYF